MKKKLTCVQLCVAPKDIRRYSSTIHLVLW